MTPIEAAKAKVGKLFAAVSAPIDLCWRELVRGGFETTMSVPSGRITGYVSDSGYYEVFFSIGERRLGCLMGGSFEQEEMAQSGPDRPVRGNVPVHDNEALSDKRLLDWAEQNRICTSDFVRLPVVCSHEVNVREAIAREIAKDR